MGRFKDKRLYMRTIEMEIIDMPITDTLMFQGQYTSNKQYTEGFKDEYSNPSSNRLYLKEHDCDTFVSI